MGSDLVIDPACRERGSYKYFYSREQRQLGLCDNGASNPNLRLVRRFTYDFEVTASGHPFWIKSIQGNGTATGSIFFTVPANAPSLLYYNCQFHSPMIGQLNIENPPIVSVVSFKADTNLVFISTGTDALNLVVAASTNLVTGTWSNLPSFVNTYLRGTNTTSIAFPEGQVLFFRIKQTLP